MAITTLPPKQQMTFDMKETVTENRFQGLWRLMKGYRLQYLGAAISLGLATIARTSTFLLLAYFIDNYLGAGERQYKLPLIVFGFIALAIVQGVFTFLERTAGGQHVRGHHPARAQLSARPYPAAQLHLS